MQQMFLGLGAKVVQHTVSDGDTNLNASTIFGSDFAGPAMKILIISSGHEIGATTSTSNRAITVPAGMSGTLEIRNAGTISGFGGAGGAGGAGGYGGGSTGAYSNGNLGSDGTAGSAGGSAIYIASNGVKVTNTGTIRGGGGGGGGGDGGDGGGATFIGGGYHCYSGRGGDAGAGGNGQGYNTAATNGSTGAGGGAKEAGSATGIAKGYPGVVAGNACTAAGTSGSRNPWQYSPNSYSVGQTGFTGGNGGSFGQAGDDGGGQGTVAAGGAAGKYIELASGITLDNTPSGTLQGTAP
tara:strand:+ start:435 stop:1322 length:888 start_codon:yes stop_codon:yes gene_type:complete